MKDDGNNGDGPPVPEWHVAGGTGSRGAYAHRPGRVLVPRAAWSRRDDGVDGGGPAGWGTAAGALARHRGSGPSWCSKARPTSPAPWPRRRRGHPRPSRPRVLRRAGRRRHRGARSRSAASAAPGHVQRRQRRAGDVQRRRRRTGDVQRRGGHGCGCCCGDLSLPAWPDAPRRSTVRRADAPVDPLPDPPHRRGLPGRGGRHGAGGRRPRVPPVWPASHGRTAIGDYPRRRLT